MKLNMGSSITINRLRNASTKYAHFSLSSHAPDSAELACQCGRQEDGSKKSCHSCSTSMASLLSPVAVTSRLCSSCCLEAKLGWIQA